MSRLRLQRAILTIAGALTACAAAPAQDCWPKSLDVAGPGALERLAAALDAARDSAPAELRPAVRFQRIVVRIYAGEPEPSWLPDLAALAADKAPGVADCAKVWLARVRMREIDRLLREHYKSHISFPEKLPAEAPADPWGEGWTYSRSAPSGLTKLKDQRYQLAPKRMPTLTHLPAALKAWDAAPPNWTVSVADVNGERFLRVIVPGKSAALVKTGGQVDGRTVLHFTDRLVVVTAADRITAIAF